MSRIRLHARRGEEGAALPLAIAFLILCSLMTAIIIDYTGVGNRSAGALERERNNVYSVTSALDTAIKYAQNDPQGSNGWGSTLDPNCPQTGTPGVPPTWYTTTVNGAPVTVSCAAVPGSAGAGGATLYPDFAILTLAPYHGGPAPVGNGNTAPGCVNEFPNELGIVQVQNSKLLQVNGNVYVNSDVDSDIWANGCPQQSTAEHIKVSNGIALQRESLHDLDTCPTPVPNPQPQTHDHVTDCNLANNNNYLPDPLSAADKAALTDPQLSADPTVAAQWQPNITVPPAPGVIHDENGNVITTCPAANPTTGYRLIKFDPGTYNDVSVFNNFTNGACPNAVLWFRPGNFYLDFTDALVAPATAQTVHQWTINDTSVRVVGGQPFAGPSSSPTLFSETWKPTTATSTVSGAGSTAFATPTNALAIDGTSTSATIANGGSSSLTLSGFKNTAGTAIPPDAQISSVRLRVAHGEASTDLLKPPTVTITPAVGSPCTVLPITPRQGAPLEDPSPSYNIFTISGANCLNDVSGINGTTKIVYSESHCTPLAGVCTNTPTTASVDGIWMQITYTTGGRVAWNPNDPTTISPSAPTVPGGCLSDRDSSLGWNNGVQFVIGGDSHIELKSGKVELCNQSSSTKQEMVVYGVPNRPANPIGPIDWTSFVTGANTGFTNPDRARIVDASNATATLTAAARTGSLQLTEFSPTAPPTWPIPGANQIPPGSTINTVTLSVTHGEGTTTTSQVGAPTVTITPAGGGGACTANTLTRRNAVGTDQVTGLATTCLNTLAKINGGVNIAYSVTRATTATQNINEALDGMKLTVTYTPPATAGALDPSTGCVTQTPYYSPTDHSPAYQGACALVQVAPTSNPANPAIDGSFPRILTLWGTVYAPSAALDVPVDVMHVPVFNRGVVARMLMLGYNVANNAIVPITTTPAAGFVNHNRDMVLTAKIGTTTVTAEVKICDYQDADPSAPNACVSGVDTIGGTDPTAKILTWKVIR